MSDHNQKVRRVLRKLGFEYGEKIATTLQGEIWRVTYSQQSTRSDTSSETAVVKVTNKSLHNESTAIVNGKSYKVHEDILNEKSILKYISDTKECPKSITQFKHFAVSHSDYYLVMEDGGGSLFDFIKKAHELIKHGDIEISHWQNVVKIILSQMIECLEYIHLHKICHSDISLENFLINDVNIDVNYSSANNNQSKSKTNIRFQTENIQIKLCDFGLAEIFDNDECKSNKYCGKKQYKSPEVLNQKAEYCAIKNDIWGLGICAFMMTVGHPPFASANDRTDQVFKYIINGYMCDVLKSWNVLHYFNEKLIVLFQSIFKYEHDRISLNEIKQHLYGLCS